MKKRNKLVRFVVSYTLGALLVLWYTFLIGNFVLACAAVFFSIYYPFREYYKKGFDLIFQIFRPILYFLKKVLSIIFLPIRKILNFLKKTWAKISRIIKACGNAVVLFFGESFGHVVFYTAFIIMLYFLNKYIGG